MFDIPYNFRLAAPCQGLAGGCDNHRARAQQAEAEYQSLPNQIQLLKTEISNLKNGEQQKQYNLLEEKTTNLRNEIIALENEANRLKILSEAWVADPKTQAANEGLSGLGWGWFKRNIVRPFEEATSCVTYTDRERDFKAASVPLQKERDTLTGQLIPLRNMLSAANLVTMQNAVKDLEIKKAKQKAQVEAYQKEIAAARQSFIANRDAEQLQLQREAEEAAAKEAATKQAAQNNKNTQTLLLVSVAIIGGYFILKK